MSRKTLAAKIIEDHFQDLAEKDYNVSARQVGLKMIEIYRLLTDEMPQSAGIHAVIDPKELPPLDFARPDPESYQDDWIINVTQTPKKLGPGEES